MDEVHRRRHVHRLDIDLQEGAIADPGLVFHLDRVVAEADDEVGRTQESALHLPASALDAAECEGMIFVDHPLGHGRGGERQIVTFDRSAQPRWVGEPHRRCAQHRDWSLGRGDQLSRSGEHGVRRGGKLCGSCRRNDFFVRGGERDVFRQIEVHGSFRLAQRECDRLRQHLGHASLLELERRLGNRLEQRMMVDPHLHAPAELIGVEVAGDGDHRRAIEKG